MGGESNVKVRAFGERVTVEQLFLKAAQDCAGDKCAVIVVMDKDDYIHAAWSSGMSNVAKIGLLECGKRVLLNELERTAEESQ